MRRLRALDALIALLVAAWAVAWVYGILHRYFDHDEFEQLYAIWRIRSGERPFYDFFEVHPPFLWYPLAAAFSAYNLFSFPLFPLRFLCATGNVVLLIALGKNVSLSFSRLPRPALFSWPAFAVAAMVIAGDLSVTWYLLEFRLDAWPNALMLLAIYRYRARTKHGFQSALVLAFVSCLALLCTPKLVAFFALFCLVSLAAEDDRLLVAAGLGAGAVAAALVAGLFLRAAGLSPALVYRLCVTYHRVLTAKGGFGHGLAQALVAQPHLLAVLLASAAAWLLVVQGRLREFPFELSVIVFLVAQPTFVAFGFPQYYAPWFLLGLLIVPYLELGVRRAPAVHVLVATGGLLVAGMNIVRDVRAFIPNDETKPVVAFNDWARRRVPTGATVVGDVSRMPVYYRSPFYHLVSSIQPSGYTTEAAVTSVGLSWIADRMSAAAYDRQLEAGRPALIVPDRLLSQPEREAIDRYRARHQGEFDAVSSPTGTVELRR